MTIPIVTTTITVRRPAHDPAADAFDPDTGAPTVVATGVNAHFSGIAADESDDGTSMTFRATLLADPVDLAHTDLVVDDERGWEWTVGATRTVVDPDRGGPENDDHVTADVTRVTGAAE